MLYNKIKCYLFTEIIKAFKFNRITIIEVYCIVFMIVTHNDVTEQSCLPIISIDLVVSRISLVCACPIVMF